MADHIELAHIPSRGSNVTTLPPSASTTTIAHDADPLDNMASASALPPADGGYRAWLFLAAATMIEVLVWGLPFSVGILHVYWTNTLFEGKGASTVTLAATLQTGLLYMGCVFLGPLLAAFPRWQKTLQFAGLMGAVVAMITSAFATKPWHLVVTMGCIYPLSGAYYLPCATLIYEWFFAKRGLATGIMFAGTGLGGTIFPFIMSGLLNRFGYKPAMISLAIGYALIGSLVLIPIRRRIPLARYGPGTGDAARRKPRVDWSFLRSLPLLLGSLTILLTSLGNFVPSLWIPSFADDMHFAHPSGTGLVALMNAASVLGNALMGFLSDRLAVRTVIAISCVGSALACALLWGFGTSEGPVVAFTVVFGLLGLSFTSLWTKMISIISKDDPVAPTLIFSLFTFIRGVGNVTSGPISQSLLKSGALKGAAGAYGGSNYGILLIYTSLTIMSGCASGMLFKEK
ncbi:hypothetical protein IAT38_005911 [Cryptococcus sp. DSM 104549]